MKELFFLLIDEYKKDVKEAIMLLNEKNIQSPYFFKKSLKGFLDDEHKIKYEFHGFGCKVKYENGITIDFDYGVFDGLGRGDGFHKGALYDYVAHNEKNKQKYLIFNSYIEIDKMVDTLVEKGKIVKDAKQELYYLPEDFINPNPIRWISKPPKR